jgi:hypothetical protein
MEEDFDDDYDPELEKQQEFIKKILDMPEDKREKYLKKRNTFEENKHQYHFNNWLTKMGYDVD